MNIKYEKHPRISHVPWSKFSDKDDLFGDVNALKNVEVVVLEKRDGENTTLYRDYHHARSINSGYHLSRSKIAQLHGNISHQIPENIRICGENLSAKHTIQYHALRSIFEVFSMWQDDICLSWDETLKLAKQLNLSTVPEFYRGVYDEKLIRNIDTDKIIGDKCEGYVIRPTNSFSRQDFQSLVMKCRNIVIDANIHWMHSKIIWNCVSGFCNHNTIIQTR